jgi:type II secretory ATPase GspE/PulE/Tfp pilus assembly ATPase PilB-like protein
MGRDRLGGAPDQVGDQVGQRVGATLRRKRLAARGLGQARDQQVAEHRQQLALANGVLALIEQRLEQPALGPRAGSLRNRLVPARRQGLFELMIVNDPLRELITKKSPTLVLKQKSIEFGMRTLRDDGLRAIFDGQTTIDEVLKYT